MKQEELLFLKTKLAKLPFRYEELYFEILDHVLCRYGASNFDNVEAFWNKEKTKWGYLKIYKLRFSLHVSETLIFLKSFYSAFFDFRGIEGWIKFGFLIIASALGFGFYNMEDVMTGLILSLWIYRFIHNAYFYHKDGDTLGEKMKILTKNWYVSVKRDAYYSAELLVIFSIVLLIALVKNSLDLEETFEVAYHDPFLSSALIFILLVSNKSLDQAYYRLLRPYLCH